MHPLVPDLRGKVTLVTGSSSGIGAATALGFARCGARVAVHGHAHRADAEQVLAQLRADGAEGAVFAADLSDSAQVARLVTEVHRHFGRIDVLINNAGGFIRKSRLVDADDELISQVFDLNARSMLAMARHVVPLMRQQGGGCIVNVSSQSVRSGGSLGSGLYASSKGYVNTFTRALSRELAPEGIRVNGVSPGVIDTPIHENHTDAATMAQLHAGIPMARIGRPDECVGAMLFLASEAMASYITGQVIEINGGSVMP